MRFRKLVVSMLSVVVCGLFAFAIGLSAQKNARISKAAPLADVQTFGSEFTERLNQVIRDRTTLSKPNAAQIAGKKVWKDFVDYFVWTTAAKVKPNEVVQLSDQDLKKLGEAVKSRVDQSIRSKNTAALGEGEITKSFFTGKLLNKTTANTSVKDSNSDEKKD